MPLRARHTSFMQTSETYMITVACPRPQTVRVSTIHHIPEQSPSNPEHAGALQGLVEAASGKPQPDSGCNAVEVQLTANPGTADHHATWVNYLRRIGPIGTGQNIADAARIERPATAQAPDLFQARRGELAAIVKPRTISGIAD
jgi:hypothetical protein